MLTLLLLEVFWASAIYFLARKLGRRPRPWSIPIILAPVIPILFASVWGRHFAVEPGTATEGRPALIADMLTYCFYASMGLSMAVPFFARGYRVPAAIFALPQIPLAWFIGLVGVMQVTGVWL